MTRQSRTARIIRALAGIVLSAALDLLDMLMYFAAVALLTFALRMALPLPAALVISVLTVSVWWGYRFARRVERARLRALAATYRRAGGGR
ncbi:hypothetical protein [Streptosporangium sandarakinum]